MIHIFSEELTNNNRMLSVIVENINSGVKEYYHPPDNGWTIEALNTKMKEVLDHYLQDGGNAYLGESFIGTTEF